MWRALGVFVLVISACGDDGVDGDAPPPDVSGPRPAIVHVAAGGVPSAGVKVYFQDDLSAVSAKLVLTDAMGLASSEVAPGAYITVVDPPGPSLGGELLYTYAAIVPGDRIELDLGAGVETHLTVKGPRHPDAELYAVATTCGETSILATPNVTPTLPLTLRNCPPTVSLVWYASNQVGNNLLGTFHATAIPSTDGGTIDLTARTYEPPVARTFTYTNATHDVVIEPYLLLDGTLVQGRIVSAQPIGGTATATLTIPQPTGALDLVVSYVPAHPDGEQWVHEWGTSGPYALDAAAAKLSGFSNLGYDAAQRGVTWSPTDGETPEVIVSTISAQRVPNTGGFAWVLIGPHSTGAAALPTLPPSAGFDEFTVGAINIHAYHTEGGLAAVRGYISSNYSMRSIVEGHATGRMLEREARAFFGR